MKKTQFIVFSVFLFCFSAAYSQSSDRLLQLLKQELAYDSQELQKQEYPPYYMAFRAIDQKTLIIESAFGAIQACSEQHTRTFAPKIRVGSPALDNYKYNAMTDRQQTPGKVGIAYLPIDEDNTEDGVRQTIWSEVSRRYDYAIEDYEKACGQSSVSVNDEDKAPCFSQAPAEKYFELPLPEAQQKLDTASWKKRLDEISALFKTSPLLQTGKITLNWQIVRSYFIDSEGSEIVQNRTYARLTVSTMAKAGDGMELPLNRVYFAYRPQDLPGSSKLKADASAMIERLSRLYKAPVADPYTGPALLSGPASGVFFHEIFGHRIEGHRLKSGGQTFKKMVGMQVLPTDFQVFCDPTIRRYAGEQLNGSYLYDDEGVKARRVNVVTDGILHEFLMSRVPLDGFPASNGHGRSTGSHDPVSRQSNLIIETKNPRSESELKSLLLEEVRKQGKEYGYYFKEVTSGFTFTGEGGSLNSFNITPLEVYRVYADGRPDELVRGVDLIGTPLSMFSNIVCAGDKPSVFTGMCGAESGWVPVTAISPMILVNKIETQRRAKSRNLPPLLPPPGYENGK